MANSNKLREMVHAKYGGKCAYCGIDIQLKGMHIDHIEPKMRGHSDDDIARSKRNRGADDFSNYNPACSRCNLRKSTYSIEKFRAEISAQVERLNKYSSGYRLAKSYGLITEA